MRLSLLYVIPSARSFLAAASKSITFATKVTFLLNSRFFWWFRLFEFEPWAFHSLSLWDHLFNWSALLLLASLNLSWVDSLCSGGMAASSDGVRLSESESSDSEGSILSVKLVWVSVMSRVYLHWWCLIFMPNFLLETLLDVILISIQPRVLMIDRVSGIKKYRIVGQVHFFPINIPWRPAVINFDLFKTEYWIEAFLTCVLCRWHRSFRIYICKILLVW